MNAHPQYKEELEKLSSTIEYLKTYKVTVAKQKKLLDDRVAYSLKHFNMENVEQFNELSLNMTNQTFFTRKLKDVDKALLKPYFARVDFTPDDDDEQRLYIGKLTLMRDEDNKILITDWRSPVATLYYEGRLGKASYECPDGEITGEITLKRQYMIENGKLDDITDIDITTNDSFLQAALGSNKDNRLKDIVSTIQSEQNRVIRADMYRPLIVQGAAGGGKTTIALHRIAYLLYTYENKLNPKNIMIIAPSRFFLSYISEVLPDLGVENVVQTTFEDFAAGFIGQKLRIKPAVKTLAAAVEDGCSDTTAFTVSGIKSSLKYKSLLEKYYNLIQRKLLPELDFEVEGYVIIDKVVIRKLFLTEYSYLPMAKRLNEIKKNLTNSLKRDKPRILQQIDNDYEAIKENIKRQMPDGQTRREIIIDLLNERDAKLKAVSNRSKTAVKNYLNRIKIHSSLKYYTNLFQNEKLLRALSHDIFTDEECDLLAGYTLEQFKAGSVETEDLAAVMYLHHMIQGGEDLTDIKHIVIDEAQDFSLFQLSALREIIGGNSFSILGDLYQGIYYYKGIQRWDDAADIIFEGKGTYMTLEQSYRTTVEIMDKANIVASKMGINGIPKAKPVIRHGSDVSLSRADTIADAARQVDAMIEVYKKAAYKSVAVICKTSRECMELKKKMHTEISVLTINESNFSGGVHLIPSYLIKGLEFDAVIIANASRDNYGCNELDTKLLYVAMTRPLHELSIIYVGELSELLL